MSDLIDRQAAVDALKNDMASLDHIIKGMSANDVRLDAYVSQRNQVNYDIYTINNLPPAQPEQHWIPVTERLPEDSVYVLLTVRRMDDSYNHVPFISTGYISWNHQCWWCAHDGNCKDANIDVIAWMPLPEPYKEVTT